jgi:hypothetical protein
MARPIGLQFHVVTTQRELAKPDCDGLFLVNRFKASGSRSYDFDNKADKERLRSLFQRPSHTAIARHLMRSGQFASGKRRRQSASVSLQTTINEFNEVNGGMLLPPDLKDEFAPHCLELEKLRKALSELEEARLRARDASAKDRKRKRGAICSREVQFKEANVQLRLRELRTALHDARAMRELIDGPGVEDGRLVLVMFPCRRTGCEVAASSSKTAFDITCICPEKLTELTMGKLVVRDVCIVLIDETWPRARRMFREIISGSLDDQHSAQDGAVDLDTDLRRLFSDEAWARLRSSVVDRTGERFSPSFERNAMVVMMGPEDAGERTRHGLITNFGRKQAEELGVCTLEAAVRLGELIGRLSFSQRASSQKALNEFLAGKPVGRSKREGKSLDPSK